MNPYRHLTDNDLLAVGRSYAGDLSYYVAGWDFPETAQREREAHRLCERRAKRIGAELARRSLRTGDDTLCPLGASAEAAQYCTLEPGEKVRAGRLTATVIRDMGDKVRVQLASGNRWTMFRCNLERASR